MKSAMHLGYLVFGAARPARWADFCSAMLGLPASVASSDGSRGWRIDGASHRLIVQEDRCDDLLALGLDCGDEAGLEARVALLRSAGCEPAAGGAALARARRVERVVRVTDPAGNTVELFHGLEQAGTPFESGDFPGGFRTGDLGIGHAALVSRDLDAMEAFYTGALGFRVTERLSTKAGPIAIRGVFLHCNRRHHSLALFDLPSRKRLHHFMLEANAHMDVGRAFERTKAAKVPLSLDIGQHPDPDGTFSFYGATPSGFDFEIGAGGKEIDPARWDQTRTSVTSSWGHRPQVGLQLRMVRDLVANKLWR